MRGRPWWFLLLIAGVLLTAACAPVSLHANAATAARPAAAAAHNDTSTPFNLVSVPALVEHEYDGQRLRVGAPAGEDVAVRHHPITYRSGTLTISGQLSVPRRRGRFPLVVVAHGFAAPGTYRSERTLRRERAFLAARGYVVLMPDYRNHGRSDRDGAEPVAEPLGYPEDLVNAIVAVGKARLPYVDASRTAVLGRSMGGGVALQAVAARPDLVDAVALYAPVSSSAEDNFRRFAAHRRALADRVRETYGLPEDNPELWHDASVRNHLDRIDVPVQVHHGTADPVTPVVWSRATVAALRRAGQTVDYHEYAGEKHTFDAAWPLMVRRLEAFLDASL